MRYEEDPDASGVTAYFEHAGTTNCDADATNGSIDCNAHAIKGSTNCDANATHGIINCDDHATNGITNCDDHATNGLTNHDAHGTNGRTNCDGTPSDTIKASVHPSVCTRTRGPAKRLQAMPLEVVRGRVLVGADGLRSAVRAQKIGDGLRYVGVVLVLGISDYQHQLLHKQGFYTMDGTHRLFTMPYEPIEGFAAVSNEVVEGQEHTSERTRASVGGATELMPTADGGAEAALLDEAAESLGKRPLAHTTMWQLSFAFEDEVKAHALCKAGGEALLSEIRRRCGAWHAPVPAMLEATNCSSVWGTPLLDYAPMPLRRKSAKGGVKGVGKGVGKGVEKGVDAESSTGGAKGGDQGSDKCGVGSAPICSCVTLLGDAAHAMTPFKGQGANQALSDAPLLAKHLAGALAAERVQPPSRVFTSLSNFEREMQSRAQAKVAASREAAGLFHSPAALDPNGYGEQAASRTRSSAALDPEGCHAGVRIRVLPLTLSLYE